MVTLLLNFGKKINLMFLDSRQGQGFVFTNLKGNGEAADGGEGTNPFLQRGIPFTNESGEKIT